MHINGVVAEHVMLSWTTTHVGTDVSGARSGLVASAPATYNVVPPAGGVPRCDYLPQGPEDSANREPDSEEDYTATEQQSA